MNEFGNLIGRFLHRQGSSIITSPDIPKSFEILSPDNVIVLNLSTDSSPGADIVLIKQGKIIIVDGAGSGKSGKRAEAIQLAELLHKRDGIYPDFGAYISISNQKSNLSIGTRAGVYVVIFGIEKGDEYPEIKPKVIINGDDLHALVSTETIIPGKNPTGESKFVLLMTDGGLDALANPKIFGDHWAYSKPAPIIAERIGLGRISHDEVPDAMTNTLLRPITQIANEAASMQIFKKEIQRRFTLFSNIINSQKEHHLVDDATIVLIPLEADNAKLTLE
jgi:hypothetical protein